MSNNKLHILFDSSKKSAISAIKLVEASIEGYNSFNPSKDYTPKELEPFDALSDRFIRSVEVCIKFFRTYEKILHGESSENLRDLLNRMAKGKLISSVELWFKMRDVRNRIVHKYLPSDLKKIYESVSKKFGNELVSLHKKLDKLIL